jgi:hypothetical protein
MPNTSAMTKLAASLYEISDHSHLSTPGSASEVLATSLSRWIGRNAKSPLALVDAEDVAGHGGAGTGHLAVGHHRRRSEVRDVGIRSRDDGRLIAPGQGQLRGTTLASAMKVLNTVLT